MRKNNRFRSDLPIECLFANHFVDNSEFLNNISIDGLCFKSNIYLEKDKIITIQIPLMKPLFRAESKVVWCHQKGDSYEVGVKFTNIEKGYRIKTVETLHYLDQYRQQVYFLEKRSIDGSQAHAELFGVLAKSNPDQKN